MGALPYECLKSAYITRNIAAIFNRLQELSLTLTEIKDFFSAFDAVAQWQDLKELESACHRLDEIILKKSISAKSLK